MILSQFITIPTSTVTSLGASVTDQITDPGTLAILVIAVAIPLTFYVISKIKKIFKEEDNKSLDKLKTDLQISEIKKRYKNI